MRVQDAAELAGRAGSVPGRRVRIAGPVGEGVMAPVHCYPAVDLSLEAHRAGDCQSDAQRRPGSETPVRQAPVESRRHPEPGQQVEEHRQADICEADAVALQQPQCSDQAGERPGDEHCRHRQLNGPLRRVCARRSEAGKALRPS